MDQRPRAIDVHWHYIPEEYVRVIRDGDSPFPEHVTTDAEGHEWISAGAGRYRLVPELYRPEAQLAEMDRRRIDLAAVSPSPTLFQYHLDGELGLRLHRLVNDGVAALVSAHPDRYAGLGMVPLQAPDLAVRELERAMLELGLRGVEISTNVAGRNLDEPEFRPFFRRAAELGAFLFVHPIVVLAPERLSRYYLTNLIGNPTETAVAITSLIFGGVYDDAPTLTACFAHGGGTFSALIGRLQHGYGVREEPKVNNARPPREYLARIYVDSLVHDDRVCRHVIDTFGAGNVMLGTDMPFDMGAPDPLDRIERLGLTAEDTERILGGTARRLLKLDEGVAR